MLLFLLNYFLFVKYEVCQWRKWLVYCAWNNNIFSGNEKHARQMVSCLCRFLNHSIGASHPVCMGSNGDVRISDNLMHNRCSKGECPHLHKLQKDSNKCYRHNIERGKLHTVKLFLSLPRLNVHLFLYCRTVYEEGIERLQIVIHC